MQLTQNPTLLADTRCLIGEGPLWHPDFGHLFFLDIPTGGVYAYNPASGQCRPFSQGRVTGGMTLQEDGSLLLFQDGCISILGLDGLQRMAGSGLCPVNDRLTTS